MPFPRRSIAPAALLLGLLALAAAMPAPVTGGVSDPLAGYPEGSYVLPDGGIAVPDKLPTPAWYTSEVHEKAVAASSRGMLYDVENDTEVAVSSGFLFIRPGAWMLFPNWCTMNFIYGSPGAYKIGSAGHCGAKDLLVSIVAAPSLVAAIGKISVSVDGGVGNDYMLVDIFPQWQASVDPNVAHVLGPQGGTYSGNPSLLNPLPVKQVGHGTVMGTGGTPRVGVSPKMDSRAFYTDIPTIGGDSGSPVLVAGTAANPLGQAIGVHTHQIVYTNHPSIKAGTRLSVVPATPVMGDLNPMP